MNKNKEIVFINNKCFSKNKIKNTFKTIPLNKLQELYKYFLIYLKDIDDKKEIISKITSAFNGLSNNKLAINNDIKNKILIDLLQLKNKYLSYTIKEKEMIIDYINPPIENYNIINIHPFTCNKRNYWESPIYKDWQSNFPIEDIDISQKLDFSKKINIWLQFDHLNKFDVTNLSKTAIDMIIATFKIYDKSADDKLVQLRNCSTHKIVDNYKDGKIYYIITQGKD